MFRNPYIDEDNVDKKNISNLNSITQDIINIAEKYGKLSDFNINYDSNIDEIEITINIDQVII